MHEYKRQLLNVLHVITSTTASRTIRTAISYRARSCSAARPPPGYLQAKLIIKLINSVADKVNTAPEIRNRLRVAFLPNYCISQAEKVVPAADLSEQISTAGMEASGTGNMKFALNGALTIGTLDGANVEIMEEVGEENIFIFGLKAHEVDRMRWEGYNPRHFYENDPELKRVLDMIASGYFAPETPGLFYPIIDALLNLGDYYLLLADYRDYIETQAQVDTLYRDQREWTRRSILNTATWANSPATGRSWSMQRAFGTCGLWAVSFES